MGSVERATVRVSLIRGYPTCYSSTIPMMMTVSPESFDATTHAQCRCGLGSAHGHASTSTGTRTVAHSRVVGTQLGFPWQDDEDEEAGAITTIDYGQLEPVALLPKDTEQHGHEHELRLIISGCRWVASSSIGSFWHDASDLDNKDDIASFALLDTLTRWLMPHWQGGTLHVRTNDVCILRGIRGDYSHSGVWNAVRSLCGQYDVELRANAVERSSSSGNLFARGNTRDGKCAAGTVRKALRNPDVVNAAVKWLMESGQQGSTVYRSMLSYLTV